MDLDPEWISALSSTGALLAAITATIVASCTWKNERRRDRRREDEARAAQAAMITALPGRTTKRVVIEYEWWDTLFPCVTIRNASELPVYDLVVICPRAAEQRAIQPNELGRGVLPPGDTVIVLWSQSIADHLTDPANRKAAAGGFSVNDYDEDEEAVLTEWERAGRPAITFTDTAGRRWRRDQRGSLHGDDR